MTASKNIDASLDERKIVNRFTTTTIHSTVLWIQQLIVTVEDATTFAVLVNHTSFLTSTMPPPLSSQPSLPHATGSSP